MDKNNVYIPHREIMAGSVVTTEQEGLSKKRRHDNRVTQIKGFFYLKKARHVEPLPPKDDPFLGLKGLD